MNNLPIEIYRLISFYLPLPDYTSLRSSCVRLYNILDKVPTLCFIAYKKTLQILGSCVIHSHRIKLDLSELNDTTFFFLASKLDRFEFIRCLQSHKSHLISTPAKERALVALFSKQDLADPEMIISLIKDGRIDPSVEIPHWNTILIWAAWKGSVKLAALLLEDPRIDPNAMSYFGNSALHIAATYLNIPVFEHLLAHPRVNAELVGAGSRTIIHSASLFSWRFEDTYQSCYIVKHILKTTRIDPSAADKDGNQAIHLCTHNENISVLETLLDDDRVDPNSRNGINQTCLEIACLNGTHKPLEILLKSEKILNETRRAAYEFSKLLRRNCDPSDFEYLSKLGLVFETFSNEFNESLYPDSDLFRDSCYFEEGCFGGGSCTSSSSDVSPLFSMLRHFINL